MAFKRLSKRDYYLNIAREVVNRGTCIRRKLGVVIVKDDSIVSTGYIGAPRDMSNCIDIGVCFRKQLGAFSGQRYELGRSVHAEQNAIINAARTRAIFLEV